jgi:hypothetical protein
MRARWGPLWLVLAGITVFLLLPVPAHAQDGNQCPANVLLAMARAGSACNGLEHDQACYGNGLIQATFQSGEGTFRAPGDKVGAGTLRQVQIGGDPAVWSVILMRIRADLAVTEEHSVTLLAFGDVTLENRVPPVPELAVSSTGLLYIRATPADDGEIIQVLGLRDTVVANGRTQDGIWLRVFVPGSNQLGWVSTSVITSAENILTLNMVDEATPYFRPFQVFSVQTGVDDAWCEHATESGLLIQTPNTFTEVHLTVNGTALYLAGTVFIQAQADGTMTINVLDGQTEVTAHGETRFIPAGARTQIAQGPDMLPTDAPTPAEPYDLGDLAGLPINNLPYRLVLPTPLDRAALDTLVEAHFAPTPTPLSPTTAESEQWCVRRVRENVSLWAGPGTYYEIANVIAAGTRVNPVLQMTDADGVIWWQLVTSNWIRASAVESTGNCPAVPTTEYAPPPATNHLSLETCMTTNGPLRAGQRVTIDFVPPAVATAAEAQQAPRIDPGRVMVGSQWLYVRSSHPVKIADERYVITYSAQWQAEPGTYRVTGARLSYVVICDVTVPLGH